MQALNSTDYYKQSTYNAETKNQLWMSNIADSHDIFCSCHTPFAHLLASIFPPGHQDRNLTVQQILERDYQECHSGGKEEESHGLAGGPDTERDEGPTTDQKEEDFVEDEEITELLAAADDAMAR